MAYYTKEQAKNMLSGTAPENRSAVVKKMIEQGHQFEGLNAPAKTFGVQGGNQTPAEQGFNPLKALSDATVGVRKGIDEWAQNTGVEEVSSRALEGIKTAEKVNPMLGAAMSASRIGNYAVPAFAEGIGNQLKAVGDPLGVGSAVAGFGRQTTALADNNVRGNDMERGVGGFAGNLASQMPALMGGQKILGLGGNIARGAGVGEKIIKAGQFAGQSLLGTETATAAGQGRLADSGELITGGVIDLALLGGGKLLKSLGKSLQKSVVPLTPTQKAILTKRKIDLGQSLIDDIGFAKNRGEIMKRAKKAVSQYDGQIDDILKNIDNTFSPQSLQKKLKAGTSYLDDLVDNAPLSEQPKIKKAIMEESKAVQKYLSGKSVGKGGLKAPDVLEIKRFFDKKINYSKFDPITNAKAAVNKQVADNARLLLDKISPNVSEKLARQAPLLTTLSALQKKGEYSGYLTDVIAASGGLSMGAGLKEGVKGAVIGVAAKKALTSPFFRTLMGAGTYSVGKKIGNKYIPQLLKTLVHSPKDNYSY